MSERGFSVEVWRGDNFVDRVFYTGDVRDTTWNAAPYSPKFGHVAGDDGYFLTAIGWEGVTFTSPTAPPDQHPWPDDRPVEAHGVSVALRCYPATDRKRCPDGGTCHHRCVEGCFRVACCGPFTGIYPNDEWPAELAAIPWRSS